MVPLGGAQVAVICPNGHYMQFLSINGANTMFCADEATSDVGPFNMLNNFNIDSGGAGSAQDLRDGGTYYMRVQGHAATEFLTATPYQRANDDGNYTLVTSSYAGPDGTGFHNYECAFNFYIQSDGTYKIQAIANNGEYSTSRMPISGGPDVGYWSVQPDNSIFTPNTVGSAEADKFQIVLAPSSAVQQSFAVEDNLDSNDYFYIKNGPTDLYWSYTGGVYRANAATTTLAATFKIANSTLHPGLNGLFDMTNSQYVSIPSNSSAATGSSSEVTRQTELLIVPVGSSQYVIWTQTNPGAFLVNNDGTFVPTGLSAEVNTFVSNPSFGQIAFSSSSSLFSSSSSSPAGIKTTTTATASSDQSLVSSTSSRAPSSSSASSSSSSAPTTSAPDTSSQTSLSSTSAREASTSSSNISSSVVSTRSSSTNSGAMAGQNNAAISTTSGAATSSSALSLSSTIPMVQDTASTTTSSSDLTTVKGSTSIPSSVGQATGSFTSTTSVAPLSTQLASSTLSASFTSFPSFSNGESFSSSASVATRSSSTTLSEVLTATTSFETSTMMSAEDSLTTSAANADGQSTMTAIVSGEQGTATIIASIEDSAATSTFDDTKHITITIDPSSATMSAADEIVTTASQVDSTTTHAYSKPPSSTSLLVVLSTSRSGTPTTSFVAINPSTGISTMTSDADSMPATITVPATFVCSNCATTTTYTTTTMSTTTTGLNGVASVLAIQRVVAVPVQYLVPCPTCATEVITANNQLITSTRSNAGTVQYFVFPASQFGASITTATVSDSADAVTYIEIISASATSTISTISPMASSSSTKVSVPTTIYVSTVSANFVIFSNTTVATSSTSIGSLVIAASESTPSAIVLSCNTLQAGYACAASGSFGAAVSAAQIQTCAVACASNSSCQSFVVDSETHCYQYSAPFDCAAQPSSAACARIGSTAGSLGFNKSAGGTSVAASAASEPDSRQQSSASTGSMSQDESNSQGQQGRIGSETATRVADSISAASTAVVDADKAAGAGALQGAAANAQASDDIPGSNIATAVRGDVVRASSSTTAYIASASISTTRDASATADTQDSQSSTSNVLPTSQNSSSTVKAVAATWLLAVASLLILA